MNATESPNPSAADLPRAAGAGANSSPVYSGLNGAVLYGATAFGALLVVALLGGLALSFVTGNLPLAGVLFVRLALWGGAYAVVAGLARYWNRARVDRLLTTRMHPGDPGSVLGILGGLVVAGGAVTQPLTLGGQSATNVQVGQAFDFEGVTLDGEPYQLGAQRGRVVLVDFWATWCAPCVSELPNLVRAHERYHSQGFDVVGISRDRGREPLQKFLEQRELPWPQILDVTRAEPLAEKYGVEAIPFTVLVGRDGLVKATSLRGSQLEAAIEQALAEPVGNPDSPPGKTAPARSPWPPLREWPLRFALGITNATLFSPWYWLPGATLGVGCAGALLERVIRQACGCLPPA
ncbi:MAG: TlpA family protein disulfide reductase [Planctomycetaceae bacterium]